MPCHVQGATLQFELLKSFVSPKKLMTVFREYSSTNSDILNLFVNNVQLDSINGEFLGVASP